MAVVRRVVLTGGPGGGKSTWMRELCSDDRFASRWLPLPDVPPFLLVPGLRRDEVDLQPAIVRLQIAVEDAYAALANPGLTVLCHRGTLDSLVYWLRGGRDIDEFMTVTGMSYEDHLGRYDGVLHLETAALGAEEYYERWPKARRVETMAEAVALDRLCAKVWGSHKRYAMIGNAGRTWPEKSFAAMRVLDSWLRPSTMDL